jgi:hypothetical protein
MFQSFRGFSRASGSSCCLCSRRLRKGQILPANGHLAGRGESENREIPYSTSWPFQSLQPKRCRHYGAIERLRETDLGFSAWTKMYTKKPMPAVIRIASVHSY